MLGFMFRAKQVGPHALEFRVTLAGFLVCSILSLTCVGYCGLYLLGEGYLFAIILIVAAVLFPVGMFFEWKYAYGLITEEGIRVRNFLKKEKFLPWDKCTYVIRYKNGFFVELSIGRKVRRSGKKPFSFSSGEVSTISIEIPWSGVPANEQELLLEIISRSDLNAYVKAEFLATMF